MELIIDTIYERGWYTDWGEVTMDFSDMYLSPPIMDVMPNEVTYGEID